MTTPMERSKDVWLVVSAGDAVELEEAVLDGLDELDERFAVEDVPSGCGSLELARLRRAATWRSRR